MSKLLERFRLWLCRWHLRRADAMLRRWNHQVVIAPCFEGEPEDCAMPEDAPEIVVTMGPIVPYWLN